MNIVPAAHTSNSNHIFPRGRIILLLILLAGPSSLQAQPRPVSNSTTRAQLFSQLALDAEKFERQNILKQLVRLVTPSVVHISAYKSIEPGSSEVIEEAGSGVIVLIKDSPMILTNRHVVKNATLNNIDIKLYSSRPAYVEKIWSDKATDIAVLSLRPSPSSPRLVPARLGNSDKAEIGDFVVAVGSPFGLSHSVTYSIISAKGRRDLKLGADDVSLQDFLQTDAAINPGNSGGPLVDVRGRVVGINTAIATTNGSGSGVAFSIPIRMVRRIVDDLLRFGRVRRAYLGVVLDPDFTTAEARSLKLSRRRGARVLNVSPGTPAARARMQINDVVTRFQQTTVVDFDHLIHLVSLEPIGNTVTLTVWRGGRQIEVRVSLADRDLLTGK
jgi:serine protease Do